LKNRTLPSILQKWSFSLSFSLYIFIVLSRSALMPNALAHQTSTTTIDADMPSLSQASTTTNSITTCHHHSGTTSMPTRATHGCKQPISAT
jgi:hypothetical protein